MSDDQKPPFPDHGPAALFLTEMLRGGVIFEAEIAVRIGEVLCEAHYGSDELQRQKPLSAIDKGANWRIEGNWNRDRKSGGPGAFFLSIDKRDGRITDIGQYLNPAPHPSAAPTIEPHLRQRKSDNKT